MNFMLFQMKCILLSLGCWYCQTSTRFDLENIWPCWLFLDFFLVNLDNFVWVLSHLGSTMQFKSPLNMTTPILKLFYFCSTYWRYWIWSEFGTYNAANVTLRLFNCPLIKANLLSGSSGVFWPSLLIRMACPIDLLDPGEWKCCGKCFLLHIG